MQSSPRRLLATVASSAVLTVLVACAPGPDPAGPASVTGAPTLSAPVPTAPAPSVARVFPVPGDVSYAHEHHGYPASDIIAACGLPYLAPYSGVVLEVDRVDDYDPAVNAGPTRGGLSVSLLGDDGVRYYGSHFQSIDEDIQPGVRVTAGEPLAVVGATGDAGACHVHFGLSPECSRTGDWWTRRGTIWPWPYLDSWRSGGDAAPFAEVQQWRAANGCPDHPLVEP